MIYADNAATTKISDYALEKMLPFLRDQYGNASSPYSFGTKAKYAVEHARRQIATSIGARPTEIIFTSGGSEANSWIFHGITEICRNQPIHIITSAIEHHSILNACRALRQKNVTTTYLPVNSVGLISIEDLETAITPHTKLVSIMLANNEIGTIQPVAEIGHILRKKGILFHTDAVQAVGHISTDTLALNVDFLTASAHKFNGPKGTGILYKRSGIILPPMIWGGKQEHDERAGTENVAGIVAAGYALEENTAKMEANAHCQRRMREIIIDYLVAKIPNAQLNGDPRNSLPGLISLSIPNVSGEALLHVLDMKGIVISTGAACNSKITEVSHVLKAIGLPEILAKGTVRISFGRNNVEQDSLIIAKEIISYCQKVNPACFDPKKMKREVAAHMTHNHGSTVQGHSSIARFEQGGFYACKNGDGYHCEKVDREKNIVSFSADASVHRHIFDCILRSNAETEYTCNESEEDLTFEQLPNTIKANNLF